MEYVKSHSLYYVTSKEAGEILEILPQQVSKLIRQNKLKGKQIGKNTSPYFILKTSVDKYKKRRKRGAPKRKRGKYMTKERAHKIVKQMLLDKTIVNI